MLSLIYLVLPAFLIFQTRWSLAAITTSLFLSQRLYSCFRLRAFDGPWDTRFTQLRLALSILSPANHLDLTKVNDKYGQIARIGPNHLLTSSPELWMLLCKRDSQHRRSPWFYHAMKYNPPQHNIFSQYEEEKHHIRRKQMSPGYSGKENPGLENAIDARVKALVNLIQMKYVSSENETKIMDLAQKLQFLALDVISEIGIGTCFGDLEADADQGRYIAATVDGLWASCVVLAFQHGWLLDFKPVGWLMGATESASTGFGKMQAHARQYIDSRLSKSVDAKSDMLASFRRHGLTPTELYSECVLQILAGTDTTATALRATMLFLMTDPRVFNRLRAEIDEAARSLEEGAILSEMAAQKLPYLQAVIRESLRVHPPAVDLFTRSVANEGISFTLEDSGKEVYIPGGTDVSYSGWAIQRSSTIFSPDPDTFRPERWLSNTTSDPEKLSRMVKTNDLIFGHGKWRCLGDRIALMEINKTVFELIRGFDWGLGNPERPWVGRNYIGLFAHNGMWVRVTKREG